MTAVLAKQSILRTASGEPPLGRDAAFFLDDQGEIFEHDNPRYRSSNMRIAVLELDTGEWLALPPSFHVNRPRYPNREAALRAAIGAMIRRARKYMRTKEGEGTQWSEGLGGRIIEWALRLKPARVLNQGAAADAAQPSGHPDTEAPDQDGEADTEAGVADDRSGECSGEVIQTTTIDPVVRSLCEAHRARKTYPAGHTFAMTNPIVNGQMVTLGTCECGETFSYTWGSYEVMDAAIEAHWQKFDHLPEKVDGMGHAIGPADTKPKRQRKPKEPGARGQSPAPIASAPRTWTTAGADASLADAKCGACQPAPIGAGTDEYLAGITARTRRLDDLGSVQNGLKMSTDGHPAGGGSTSASERQLTRVTGGESATTLSDDFWDSPLIKAAVGLAWREPPQLTEQLRAMLDFSWVYAIKPKVSRPLLRWHGGKWKLAPWVMSHFPEHRIYVEPFGGAGSVLLRKTPALTEIYNDLDVEVVNLFRVLRSAEGPRLIELLRLTPFAREEFDEAFEYSADNVERARRLIVRSFFAGGSRGVLDLDRTMAGFNGGSARSRGDSPNSSHAQDWSNYAQTLPAAIARLTSVVIENRPATELMRQHDAEETLFYVDPPYMADTRSDRARKAYRHELDDDQHIELLACLKALSGMVVLSGYPHPTYDEMLRGWRRVEREAMADGANPRTEVLWINPACAAALDRQEPRLFDLASFDAINPPPPLDNTDMMEAET